MGYFEEKELISRETNGSLVQFVRFYDLLIWCPKYVFIFIGIGVDVYFSL